MKHKITITFFPFAVALLITLGLSPASAKEPPKRSDNQVISQIDLPTSTATDLFLRRSAAGRAFLYVVYSNHAISVLDVTNPKEPKEADELHLIQGSPQIHLRPLGPDAVLATAAPDPSQQLMILDENVTPVIAKQFAKVDAYTVDGGRSLVYVAEKSKLSIFQFDRPLTRDAEIWEQSYKSR